MKYFIFDMDGVLVDSEPMHKIILKEVCQTLGMQLSQTYFNSLTGMASLPMWTKIKEDNNLKQSPEELDKIHKQHFFQRLPDLEAPAIDGVISVIKRLKNNGFSLALASSSSMRLIEKFTNQLDITPFFDVMISGENVERSKPHPDIFLKVAEWYGVSPDKFWVIEDSKNGVQAAKSATMSCIGFYNPNSGSQDISKADIIIHSMSEITDKFIQTSLKTK